MVRHNLFHCVFVIVILLFVIAANYVAQTSQFIYLLLFFNADSCNSITNLTGFQLVFKD